MRLLRISLVFATLLGLAGCGKGSEGGKKQIGPGPGAAPAAGSAGVEVVKAKYKLTELVSEPLGPSSKPQTVQFKDRISVTVPPGMLEEKRELKISAVEDSPAPTYQGVKHLAVFDVSLGKPQEFRKQIDLELACDSVQGAPQLVWLESWDDIQQAWCALPSKYDPKKKVVRAATNHLCPVAIASAEQISSTTGQAVLDADKGKWYYADEYFVMSFIKADVEASTCDKKEPKGFKAFQDPSVPVYHDEMPRFVEDVWCYLHRAHEKYCLKGGAGFRDLVPFDEDAWVFSGGTKIFVGGNGSPSRSKFTGNVSVALSPVGFEGLRFDLAHELFHAIQSRYYNCAAMTLRKWWMECTADYAAEKVACAGVDKMGGEKIHPRFYEKCLTSTSSVIYDTASEVEGAGREFAGLKPDRLLADDPHGYHEYTAAFYIQFLVDRKGINFREMFEKVAESYNPLVFVPLDAFLRSKGTSFEQSYREFVRWWIFCADGPLRARLKVTDLAATTREPGTPEALAAEQGTARASFTLDVGHSAKVWPFRVEMRKTTDDKAELRRKVRIDLSGIDRTRSNDLELPWYLFAKADVFVLEHGSPDEGGGAPAAQIDPISGKDADATAEVEVPENAVVYVVVYNTNLSGALGARVDVVSPVLRIVRPVAKGSEAVAGTKYTWTVKKEKTGIPKDAVYKWKFENDVTAEGDSVEYAFPDEGNFTVQCTAEWKSGKVEDETKVKVKPGETLVFPSVGMQLELPYKYRVWGVKDAGDGKDDTIRYELEDSKASWKGLTYFHSNPLEELNGSPVGTNPIADPDRGSGTPATTMRKTGSEDYRITLDAKAEKLVSVEFSARVDTPERVVRNRFVFENVPRGAAVDLGPNAGKVYLFWLKGEEMKKYSTVCEAGGEGDAFETDPETNKSVKVRGKSALTSAVWADSTLMVSLSTVTMEELQARADKGLVDKRAVEEAFEKQIGPILEKLRSTK